MMRQNCQLSTCNDVLGLEYNLHLQITRPKRCRFSLIQSALIMSIGIFLGFVVCDLTKQLILHRCDYNNLCCPQRVSTPPAVRSNSNTPVTLSKNFSKLGLVYVGVMTAEKYLNTRANAVYTSWATTIQGKVEFFTSAKIKSNLPVVNLPGVMDSVYPPQKKSFMMLKYMHDNYINEYEWFIRADDDVYVHGERLATFLRSLNSSRKLYMGQAGLGNTAEHGHLGLASHDNYCMGGTTMVFSRATLREMVPQINFCIKHLVSTHEDVEIGRCVRKFAGTSCPWAFEFRNLFYQNHDEPNGSFTRPGILRNLRKPITMHPVKDPAHLHRMQAHFLDDKLRGLRYKELLLQRDGRSVNDLYPREQSDTSIEFTSPPVIIPWVYFDKSYYSHSDQAPKHRIPAVLKEAVQYVSIELLHMINSRARELGRHIDFRGLLYGYQRVCPLRGADFIIDLLLSYHRHRGRQVKIPVRRHSYLNRPFTQPEIRVLDPVDPTVYLIVPVLGRREPLDRFLKNYVKVCLKNDNSIQSHLLLVVFDRETSSDFIRLQDKVSALNSIYKDKITILTGDREFSRARALQQGAIYSPQSALLLFIDLDIEFDQEALGRVLRNTVKGSSAFFPIVFSQYDPSIVCSGHSPCSETFTLSQSRGYWRHFGFGIASIYRDDFLRIGGFDLSIRGWGNEDVEFYSRCVGSELSVIRVPEPGLVHVFHPVTCPDTLSASQMKMCMGSMHSNLAPASLLSQLIYYNHSKLETF